ncbi:MAG: class C sortase [Blautia sp.]|nr:class C sortase [Blautia sp.]
MGKRVISRLPYLIGLLLLLTGLGFIAYPTVSDWMFRYSAKAEIVNYDQKIQSADGTQLEKVRQEAIRYNAQLSGEGTDTEDGPAVVSYNDLLAVTEAIGYLEIPKLGLYLPIFHGIEDEILKRGIGHLPETSLPVGGTSTHCVLSGHSGLPAAKLLTDLDQVGEGDVFNLHVLDETLAYEVDQIKVVLPTETDDIRIVPGEDYVTLLTCTPYGVNTHRLLVRGTRVPYVPTDITIQTSDNGMIPPQRLFLYLGAAAVMILLLLILIILFAPSGRKKK